jgi:hypothetical protein
MEDFENKTTNRENDLKKEVIELKSRSMRDNLLFFGIPEEKGEKDSDCVNKVLDLIENKLQVENASENIKLHRAHRIGRYDSKKTRPIVAKFAYYPDREKVRLNASKLAKPYGISQQYPTEVMESRKRLVPIMLEARRQGKEAYIAGDRLFIDRRLYREGNTTGSI